MSERFKIFYFTLWVLHPVLQVSIGAFMLRRGLLRQFKFFFGYLVTQLITFSIVFPAYMHNSASLFTFYSYWVCNALSVTFGFLVIHEVFVDVFRLFHTLRDLGTVLFKWAGLVMLLVAGVVAVSTNSSEVPPWMQAIITSQRCVRMIQVGMVMFLLFFANYVGVNRKQRSFGIALGFGAFACFELLLISSWIGSHLTGPWISMVNMTAYNCSLGLWLGYAAAKQPVPDLSRPLLKPQRWEQSLSDIHHTVPADSLIPMFEGMVDRALSRQPMPHVAEKANAAAAAGNGGSNEGTGNFAAAIRAASKT
jgi:hypothetical protein